MTGKVGQTKGGSYTYPGEEPQDTAGNGSPESAVTEEELAGAVERIGARKAPGPDGVPSRLWKEVAGVLAPMLRTLFDRCLSPMEGGADSPVAEAWTFPRLAFRLPVCVPSCAGCVDQPGKLLERVVAARLESRRDPGLHDSQFGFRNGQSTADTIGNSRPTHRLIANQTTSKPTIS
jgi:hypothetical protein